jgi:hypothetical protein
MIRFLSIAIVLVCVSEGSSLRAQDDPDGLNIRASRLIDSTMAMLNIRAQRFNEELAKVNILKPLDAASLTKELAPKNEEMIKDFLNYLDVYRSLGERQRQEIEDSVKALRSKMPSHHRASFLQEFMDAYTMDQTAFDKYTLALTKVFTSINAVLAFMETSTVTTKDNKLEFSNKKEYDSYSELIAVVEKSNKKMITASANSQKATIDASEMMQKAYGAIRK